MPLLSVVSVLKQLMRVNISSSVMLPLKSSTSTFTK